MTQPSETRIDAAGFRNAMARLGASVHIVTSTGPAGTVGLTASAVCSVTDSPPTLLLCVNQSSSAHDPLTSNAVLCVNTLSSTQEMLSRRFSSRIPMSERFADARWHTLSTGSPVLDDALVSFDCRIVSSTRYGTHSVIVAQVVEACVGEHAARGLMYFDRCYHAV
ncbi:flavin reductase [Paraburkholderia fungorum]|uniref:flavin reductase n=1 Tax=Paraburkholderia fungorum TaxID=134537 RepID=UPI0038B92C7F